MRLAHRLFDLAYEDGVAVERLRHRSHYRPVKTSLHILITRYVVGREPQPREQVHIVAHARQQGILGRDDVG